MTSKPKVLHLRRDSIPPDAIYVGRGCGSRWGNPFIIGRDGTRAEVISKYKAWLPQQRHLIAQLPSLRGRDLVCFCAPLPCHGDILLEAANGRLVFGNSRGLARKVTLEGKKGVGIVLTGSNCSSPHTSHSTRTDTDE